MYVRKGSSSCAVSVKDAAPWESIRPNEGVLFVTHGHGLHLGFARGDLDVHQ